MSALHANKILAEALERAAKPASNLLACSFSDYGQAEAVLAAKSASKQCPTPDIPRESKKILMFRF
jgi:hypothetical protein